MPTDEERRTLAKSMRAFDVYFDMSPRCWLNGTLFGMDVSARSEECIRGGMARLADMIEPSCESTASGIDSICEWCRERLEGADGAEDVLYMAIMKAIDEYRHPELAEAQTVRRVDRDALLALADGLDADADRIIEAAKNARFGTGPRMGEAKHDACEWRSIARRIREALGVE